MGLNIYTCSYGWPLDPDNAAITQDCPVHCPDVRLKVRGLGAGAEATGIMSAEAKAKREIVGSIVRSRLVRQVDSETLNFQTLGTRQRRPDGKRDIHLHLCFSYLKS